MNTPEDLWQRLSKAQLVTGDLPPPAATRSVWYIRAMLGVAGWIGAWFLMAFFGVAFSLGFKSSGAMLIIGVLCCSGAFAIFRKWNNNDFTTQFGLAVSLTGQFAIGFGIMNLFQKGDSPEAFLLFAAFEAVLVAVIPNFVHRVLSAFSVVAALAIAFALEHIIHLLPGILAAALTLVWLNEFRWASQSSKVRAIGYGLTLGLLFPINLWSTIWSQLVTQNEITLWLGPLMIGAMLVKTVFGLLARYEVTPTSRTGIVSLAIALMIAATAFKAPGISVALLVVILGFANANRILFGLGIIALLLYLSHFYYQLDVNLLVKSMALTGTGCVLIAARYGLHLLFPVKQEEKSHA